MNESLTQLMLVLGEVKAPRANLVAQNEYSQIYRVLAKACASSRGKTGGAA